MNEILENLSRDGYAIATARVSAARLEGLRGEADRVFAESASRGGARNLLGRRFGALTAPSGEVVAVAREVLGHAARPTKLTLFNKTPEANWVIRWHQDATIAVSERREVEGFTGWSVKEGLVHVHPPAEVLEQVLAVRLHLDDTPADNGALKVLPGTHRFGRLGRRRIAELRERIGEEVCELPAGGMMLMRPLLLHASSRASSPANRRVLHFEFSARPLPGGLDWV